MNRILALAAVAALIAAPASFAQTESMPPAPPTTEQPANPPAPEPTPEPAVPPAEPAATPTAPAPEGEPRCRTSKEAGDQCSCLSAPTEFGTSTPAESGTHNMCVVPQGAASNTPEQ